MSGKSPKIRIVSGKGGVGKTVVTTALAMAHAQAGRRVLLCEMHGRDRVAALLQVEPVGYTLREVFEDLTVVDINPREAIREYALMTLRFDAVYKAVFDNRLVRNFINLVPSLGELVMLGKVWFHAEEQVHGRPRFDVVLVDAPATGHAIALLGAPRAVHNTVPAGPMRDNAALLHGMLTDRERTALQIVTTPEEMPVTEALELATAARGLGVALDRSVINQRLEPLPAGALEAVLPLRDDPVLMGTELALRLRESKRREGEDELQRLPAATLSTAISLPRLVRPEFNLQAVEALAACFVPLCREGLL